MMVLPTDRRAILGLTSLIYTAAETLHDGCYFLPAGQRRSNAVVAAQNVFHELVVALGNGVMNEPARLTLFLHRIDDVLWQLARLDIDPVRLMVRRDYATPMERVTAARSRRYRPRLLPRLRTPGRKSDPKGRGANDNKP